MPKLTPTVDPHIFIEDQRDGYIRYINPESGLRWEVHGQCDFRGYCLEGTINQEYYRRPRVVAGGPDMLVGPNERERLDVPTGPAYDGSCCPLKIVVLDEGR